jgi:Domain of unknown function (DUF4105)
MTRPLAQLRLLSVVCLALLHVGALIGCGSFRRTRQASDSKSSPANVGPSDRPASRGFAARLASNILPDGIRVTREKVAPTHHKDWRADLTVLPYAEIGVDRVRLVNIRDCVYRTEEDYDVRHYNRLVMLNDVRTVDFIVVPFKEAPLLAHTMLSFGMADGEQLVFSFEARLQKGQTYAAVGGALNAFELIYVVGSERDLIRLRTRVRKVDVYLYPILAQPDRVQKLFVAAVARVNEIARQPEFYDTLNNNCTTNIVDLINELKPGAIPQDIRVLLPGHSDKLAYELGLLAVQGPFEQIRAACKINLVAELNYDAPDFSQRIRQR